jgi:hypothetical protein
MSDDECRLYSWFCQSPLQQEETNSEDGTHDFNVQKPVTATAMTVQRRDEDGSAIAATPLVDCQRSTVRTLYFLLRLTARLVFTFLLDSTY